MIFHRLLVAAAALVASPLITPAAAAVLLPRQTALNSTKPCNNSPSLCSRSYSDIIHLGTHNAPFTRNKTTSFSDAANQYFPVTAQLDAGVRLLQAQVQLEKGEIRLCHTSCFLFDAGLLVDWLGVVKGWMDKNPNEVVTLLIVNPDNIRTRELESVFSSADLADMTYTPPSVTSWGWPTLADLIAANKRLVIFLSTNTENSYILPQFSYVWETAYQNTSPSNFSCSVDRGHKNNTFPLMNQWVYEQPAQISSIQIFKPNTTAAAILNGGTGEGNMRTRLINTCQFKRGFVLVDFFSGQDEMGIIDEANGITDAVGRKKVPQIEKKEETNTGTTEEKKSAGARMKEMGSGWGPLRFGLLEAWAVGIAGLWVLGVV